jgi:predicted ATPase
MKINLKETNLLPLRKVILLVNARVSGYSTLFPVLKTIVATYTTKIQKFI